MFLWRDRFARRRRQTSKHGDRSSLSPLPTREGLLAAICDERFLAIVATRRKDRSGDPAEALRAFITAMATATATSTYSGLAASFGTVLQQTERGCASAMEEAARLLDRTRQAGLTRHELSVNEIVCLITAVALASAGDVHVELRIALLVDMLLGGVFMTAATS